MTRAHATLLTCLLLLPAVATGCSHGSDPSGAVPGAADAPAGFPADGPRPATGVPGSGTPGGADALPGSPAGGSGTALVEQAGATDRLAATLIGMTEQDAVATLESADPPRTHRVVERDGEGYAVTMDYSPNRVNLRVADGTVVGATAG